jgi:hypothetical protein
VDDYFDPWRFIEREIREEEERRRWYEELLRSISESSTYWDDFSGYYDSIWDPQISMFVIRYIFLLIREESQKEREWFENLKKNLKRFLP